jgi:hypothetical protein
MPPRNCVIKCRKGRQHRDFVSLLSVTLRSEKLPEHHAMRSEYRQIPIKVSVSRSVDSIEMTQWCQALSWRQHYHRNSESVYEGHESRYL